MDYACWKHSGGPSSQRDGAGEWFPRPVVLLGDLISELAPYAREPREALRLAAKAHEVAIIAVGPKIFGCVFQAEGKPSAKLGESRL
jgi:hypothetical protein